MIRSLQQAHTSWLFSTSDGHNALTLAICFLAPWVLFS